MNRSYTMPSSLPNQAVDYVRKKNDKLAKETVDALEVIANAQLRENKKLNDYYNMFNGNLVWADYSGEDTQLLDGIMNELLVDPDIKAPSFVKHYDILGIITNQIVGEWLSSKDDFNIDCIGDPITDNEYLRERSRRIEEVVVQNFQLEYKKYMAEIGFTEQGEFESEEEQQAYMQELQQIQAKIKPLEDVEKEMRTWKTQAVDWANAVIEQDYFRFRLDDLDREETIDYVLTGRYFRNYFVGYDYYKPERWDPRLVFFSRDESIENPQDAEYVGIQYKIPVYKIKERFGHMLSSKEIKKLEELYQSMRYLNTRPIDLNSKNGLKDAITQDTYQVPFYNYFEYQEALEAQELFGVPMGEDIVQTEDGEVRVPYYLSRGNGGLGFSDPSIDRKDFTIRKDTVLVTEGYYKSMKKMWFAKYRDENGIEMTDVFSAELLPEVIKDLGWKVDKKTSLVDLEESDQVDIIYPIFVPEVRRFIKINANLGKDFEFYYDDVLPYQIKGDSNIYDVKLPVSGIISSNFIANKIRPYQIAYNICLNQIMNMMEKELGLFFLFDINLLPTEYKVYGDTDQALMKLQDFIKDTGIAPIDTNKQNTQQNMSQANTFMYQDLSYTNHISARMQWAENYKRLALEQIGITPQRMGTPSEYETAEGIRQGVQASYAQTESLFSKLTSARLKSLEIHLAVAQYSQKEYIDADFVYMNSDNNRAFVHLSDPDFPLRRIGVMPVNDSRKRSQRDTLIQTLMSLNTLGGDILDYAELFTSKSTQEILEKGRKARLERLKEQEAQRQHEQEMLDKQIQATAEAREQEITHKSEEARLEREKDIEVARINALGRAADKQSDAEGFNQINRQAELALKEEDLSNKIELGNKTLQMKENSETERNRLREKELELKEREIAHKERRESVDLSIAGMNKN